MLLAGAPAAGQTRGGTNDSAGSGSPAPVLTHETDAHVVIRATRITEPIRVDGRLDEAVYGEVSSFSEFIQQEPVEGAPVSEKTEVWLE